MKKLLSTSFRSAIHATDSTCNGCTANTAATIQLGQMDRVADRSRRYTQTRVHRVDQQVDDMRWTGNGAPDRDIQHV